MATEERPRATFELLALGPATGTGIAGTSDCHEILHRSARDLSYNDFYWQYMKPNWPVIITDVSNDWECQNWTSSNDARNDNNTTQTAGINFNYLKKHIDDRPVPIADCNSIYFNSHAKLELKFHDFLRRWEQTIESSESEAEKDQNSNETIQTDNLYLKDWHLAAELPGYKFYKVPKYFASDWLNEQLINEQRDDYRFVYMGPKDSWTSFHSDVFGSFSWSTNIVGHKKWLIMPPGEELKLSDSLGNLPFSIDEKMLNALEVRYFTINQTANEAVFVPSGWYHQVWNLTDTISVNHNWFNACNIEMVWTNLLANMHAVRKEISDCRQMDNFEAHCQTMLRASFGINYLDFIELLEYIAARRMAAAINSETETTRFLLFDSYKMNDYHIQSDLECLKQLLTTMLKETSVEQLTERCQRLLHKL
ncbi:LOW QUALITY PROTEIN: 2-oxoglutarate and iron-dependent oxygenase JMJD4 homolog [Drosophila tropicalis]|uniref:LOW QUALITY PROTEIN: 2-oxoglutarate and iron-dependent oxygenase JMJD4 homolog n=1 Tax=Drosophila tropicalis TaxID=46794 RepID=UPI0035AB8644